jgi:hypothetical protein
MKKILLQSFICAICFAFITSCSKDVKTPATPVKNAASTKTTTTTTTGTQTQNQGGHTCGEGGGDYQGYYGGGHG